MAKENKLTDIEGHWAEEDIRRAVKRGLFVGYPDDTFRPEEVVNRGQLASVAEKTIRYNTRKVPNMIQEVKESIVVVETKLGDKKSIGTGTIIDKTGKVLTNFHCVGDMDTEEIGEVTIKVLPEPSSTTQEQTKDYKCKYIDGSTFDDLALMQIISDDEFPFIELDDEPAVEGEPIQVFGHPMNLRYTTSQGQITQDVRMVSMRGLMQTDASINPGNSGGACVSEISEKLVAVPVLKRMDAEGVNFLIPLNTIKLFLKNSGAELVK